MKESRRKSILINPALAIVTTTNELPAPSSGRVYDESLDAVGGAPPYTWELEGSSILPFGRSLDDSGHIFGAASHPGATSFTVVARDSVGHTDTARFSLAVKRSFSFRHPLQWFGHIGLYATRRG